MSKTRIITTLGLLAAIAIVLALLFRFPIFAATPYLEYEPGDVPILIAGFLLGPLYGLAITVIVSVIQGVTVSASGGWIGIVMHICGTGALVAASSVIYRRRNTIPFAIAGIFVGLLAYTSLMIGLNYILTPLYLGRPAEEITAVLWYIIAFNLIKGAVNSVIAFNLFKLLGFFGRSLRH